MKTIECITLGGFAVSIASWFVTNWLNRRNEIAKVRLKFRIEIMQSFLDCISDDRKHVKVNDDGTGTSDIDEEYKLNFITALEQLALFGTKEEYDLGQSIYKELGENKYDGNNVTKLRDCVVKRLKEEIKYDDESICTTVRRAAWRCLRKVLNLANDGTG